MLAVWVQNRWQKKVSNGQGLAILQLYVDAPAERLELNFGEGKGDATAPLTLSAGMTSTLALRDPSGLLRFTDEVALAPSGEGWDCFSANTAK